MVNVNKISPEEQQKLLEDLMRSGAMQAYVESKNDRTELTMISEHVDAASEFVANMGKIHGITTGFQAFDELTLGIEPGDLVILAGQTSHGKSLLANNLAYQMAKNGDPVLFVTLEMTKAMTTARFMQIAQSDGVDVAALPIYFQMASELRYDDIGMLMGKAKEWGCKAVFIDHLHFFPRGQGDNVRNEISRITKHMKEAAVSHEVPVILLSHVRRLQDKAKKPGLDDLKESGSIEQDADVVLMIWRDLREESEDTNYVELSLLKNRNKGFYNGRLRKLHQKGAVLRRFIEGIPRSW